ncbi:uncharacterized protein [Eurosta solidaginis]|uniref:uncharacterized protein isoform X2 n=1 Tax=Eurosta solidaginis TaxID=178769 RepID=UPI003530DF98
MVFDLSTTKILAQSSTSCFTDNFFEGCQRKNLRKCGYQYQNCECRPCCISSMINDHTYTLLKKICRKVIRDYQRQQSREKYTIFDGGNGINVEIHRSSFDRNSKSVSAVLSSPDDYNNNTVKRTENVKINSKNYLYDSFGVGRDTRTRTRNREDFNKKQRTGRVKKANRNNIGEGKHDGGTTEKGDELVAQVHLFPKKFNIGKKIGYAFKNKSDDKGENKAAASKKEGTGIDNEERHQSEGVQGSGKKIPDKNKQPKPVEDDEADHEFKKNDQEAITRKGSNKNNERDFLIKERYTASKHNPDGNMKGHNIGPDGLVKNKRGIDKTNHFFPIGKISPRERKNFSNFPVVSGLRAKVRGGHDVTPVLPHRSAFSNNGQKKYINRNQRQLFKTSKDGINEYRGFRCKIRRFRTSRCVGLRFVRYREYPTMLLSRCDQVRPCDILRVNMEQREIFERQRCFCPSCPCDCSDVYFQAYSRICSHLY